MKYHVITTFAIVICLTCFLLSSGGCSAYKSVSETTIPATSTLHPSITPKPTVKQRAAPKPSVRPSAKPSSDPFGAGEYSHPDDFYYDHYDDFFDYEDAEDYWEDNN